MNITFERSTGKDVERLANSNLPGKF